MSRPLFPTSVAKKSDGSLWAGAVFELRLRTVTAVKASEAYPIHAIELVTDADGRFPANLSLPTPESGAWRWRLKWPDGKWVDALVAQGDGSAIEIDDWVALSEQAGSEAGTPAGEFINRLWTAVAAADDGQMLETAGGDLALVDAPEGMPEPGSDGLWARLRASGVGSWLAAGGGWLSSFWGAANEAAARGAIGAAMSAGSGTAGELATIDASGDAVRAGFGASPDPIANTAVLRTADNTVLLGDDATAEVALLVTAQDIGVHADTRWGPGMLSHTANGEYHHQFGSYDSRVSAIARTTGALMFLGDDAATNRAAQRTEIGAAAASHTHPISQISDAGATGAALLALPSPGAIRFLRINADGTVTQLSDVDFLAAISASQLVLANSNIGVGVSPNAAYKLHVNGALRLEGDGSAVSIYFKDGSAWRMPSAPATGTIYFDVPRIRFRDASASFADSLTLQNFRVGIRSSSPGAQLDVRSESAATIVQILRAFTSQTASILEAQNISGTVLAKIEANGVIQGAGYKSSDGSAGWTGTFTNGDGDTVTVKNGLITAVTPP